MTENSTHGIDAPSDIYYPADIIHYLSAGISAFGLLGNVLVIGLIALVKNMRTTVRLCLASLAVVDLIFTVVMLIRGWSWLDSEMGVHFCVFIRSLNRGAEVCSVLLFLLVSVERYTALCHPIKFLGWWTRTKTCLLLAVILLVTVVVCIPYGHAIQHDSFFVNGTFFCYLNYTTPWFISYETAIFSIFFLLPAMLLMFLYFKMNITLKSDPLNTYCQSARSGTTDSRYRTIAILTMLIAIFIISLLPIKTIMLTIMWSPEVFFRLGMRSYFILSKVAILLQDVNHALHPAIYFLMSSDFRTAFRRVFCKTCTVSNERVESRQHGSTNVSSTGFM